MGAYEDLFGVKERDGRQDLADELVRRDRDMLRDLVSRRHDLDLSQDDVAKRLGVSQSAVNQFERIGNDPRLSTIRRYAMAVDVVIHHQVRAHGQEQEQASAAVVRAEWHGERDGWDAPVLALLRSGWTAERRQNA